MKKVDNFNNMSCKIDLWKSTDAVCFDVDSTVITEEGIDELAKYCKKEKDVSTLTAAAMQGAMTYRDSLILRLSIIKPTLTQVNDFIKTHPAKLTTGVKELIEILHGRNVPVYLISGGFMSIIAPIAAQLNIPLRNVFANRLKFFHSGEYAGFDEDAPTSRNGGKAVVIETLKKENGYNNLFLIGDGSTDLEACPPADGFIGFGGNVVRENVKSKAEWFVTEFKELIKILQK